MDDFFKSVKTTDDAFELQKQLIVMLKRAGFNFTKWVWNVKEVIERVPESERGPAIKVVGEEIVMPVERALGVIWDTRLNYFVYEVVKRDLADTRLKILSLKASLFHPIGFLAPFLCGNLVLAGMKNLHQSSS